MKATNMDYEKKYSNALELAKKFMNEHPTRAEQDLMVCLFPELAESEEDENKFELLHTCICHCINDPNWEYSRREKVSKEIIPFIERLKSLYYKQSAEWSDEDEKMRDKTLVSLNALIDCVPHKYEEQITKQINWLQVLRPQPHWKPSEEQMKCLKSLPGLLRNFRLDSSAQALQELYEHLKKL